MKPTDLRDATFDSLRQGLGDQRRAVYQAWIIHAGQDGLTTRDLALRSGIDILNVRPRTTDLCAVGLVELVGSQGTEGKYKSVDSERWSAWHQDHISGQQRLI